MLIKIGTLSVCLAALATPLSTSLLGLFSIIAFLAWFLGGGLIRLPGVFRANPSTAAALGLFLLLLAAIAYSPAHPSEAFAVLKKYRELAMLPVVFCLLSSSARYRALAVSCFLAGCILLMILSYMMFFDLLPGGRYGHSLVFHITHSFFMAVLSYWSLHNAMIPGTKRYFWAVVAFLSTVNIFYIAPGRTGMFVFCCLMLLFLYQQLSFRKWIASILVFCTLLAGAFYTSDNFSGRIREAVAEIQKYTPGESKTSVGQRFDWWQTSIALIREKPVLGHGTGSYRMLHQTATQNTRITATDNPHNEFLFIAVQTGLIGLALFISLAVLQLFEARKVANPERYLFQGVLLALLAGSLMNSLLFDSQQGHCYLFMSAALLAGRN